MKRISVVTPCFNEEGNVRLLSERVKEVFAGLPEYEFEHIFADNRSEDNTLAVLKAMALEDQRIKIIVNARNYGSIRSPFNAVLAARGDAIVMLAADLQDPPEMIAQFVERWEQGYQVVFGVRAQRQEPAWMTGLRRAYYRLLNQMSEDELVSDAGDFVLFDKKVQDVLRQIHDTNPYLRGLLASLGFSHTGIEYHMGERHSGKTKASATNLIAYALTGFIHHTMLPLRLATFVGLSMSGVSILAAFIFLFLKLLRWSDSPPGIATIIIGLFFLSGVQLFVLGFLGELVGAIYRQGRNLPLVVEVERINFDEEESE